MSSATAKSKPPVSGPQKPKFEVKNPFAETVRKAYMDIDSKGNVIVNGTGGPGVLGKFVEFIETKFVHELDELPAELRIPENFVAAYVRNKSRETGTKLDAKRFIDNQELVDSTMFVVYEPVE